MYRHFKGGLYIVIGFARHSETEENLVLYKPVDDEQVWVRPSAMFEERVCIGGVWHSRFEKIAEPAARNKDGVQARKSA